MLDPLSHKVRWAQAQLVHCKLEMVHLVLSPSNIRGPLEVSPRSSQPHRMLEWPKDTTEVPAQRKSSEVMGWRLWGYSVFIIPIPKRKDIWISYSGWEGNSKWNITPCIHISTTWLSCFLPSKAKVADGWQRKGMQGMKWIPRWKGPTLSQVNKPVFFFHDNPLATDDAGFVKKQLLR